MHISNIYAAGNSPADFTNSVASCNAATVAANASCTVSVTFSPTFSGPRSETLTVTDDAPNSPQVLNIFANAPPAFSISSPSTALSASAVSAGQSASYAHCNLHPGLISNGTVSFTCTGAPLGATCQAPASVVLNTGAPAAFTVTVVTSGAQSSLPKSLRADRPPRLPYRAHSPLHLAFRDLFWYCETILNRADSPSTPIHHGGSSFMPWWRWRFSFLFYLWRTAAEVGEPTMPAAQKSSIVTPSGTSTLVLTPTATNASSKALQLPLIQLTLTVN